MNYVLSDKSLVMYSVHVAQKLFTPQPLPRNFLSSWLTCHFGENRHFAQWLKCHLNCFHSLSNAIVARRGGNDSCGWNEIIHARARGNVVVCLYVCGWRATKELPLAMSFELLIVGDRLLIHRFASEGSDNHNQLFNFDISSGKQSAKLAGINWKGSVNNSLFLPSHHRC